MALELLSSVTNTTRRFLSLAASQSLQLLTGGRETKRAVIFDKDGTLIDIHAQWAPWIRQLVARIEAETDLSISARVYSSLGFDDNSGRLVPGILGEGTMAMVRDCLTAIVSEEGALPQPSAEALVRTWLEEGDLAFRAAEIRPIGDTAAMFHRLKAAGFQIAVNTSDNRAETRHTLDRLGVAHLVDVLVCGNDDWMVAKPHPVSAYSICAQLGVRPEDTIMIGDSLCDMQLGTNAKLGCTVGVLSGITPKQALQADACVLAEDITEAVHLILQNHRSWLSSVTIA